nr:hypothetical protein [Pirellula staleyi]
MPSTNVTPPLTLLLLCILGSSAWAAEDPRPNILLILADDK